MENNSTFQTIINQIKPIKAWSVIKDNLKELSVRPTKLGNYGVFYEDNFTGIFVAKSAIDLKELKESGIKYHNKIMD